MAQQKKSTAKKPAGKKSGGKKGSSSTNNSTVPVRMIVGVLMFLLGIFAAIGYFNSDGVIIKVLCDGFKGLLGWGYYLAPPLIIIASVMIFISRGRKKMILRGICTLLASIAASGLVHLFLYSDSFAIGDRGLAVNLWNSGIELQSCGFLGGGLAVSFTYLFSRIGAIVLIFAVLIILVLVAFNFSPSAFSRSVRENREKRAQETVPFAPEEPEPVKKQAKEDTPSQNPRRKRRTPIDIPLDGEERPAPPKPVSPKEVFEKVKSDEELFTEEPGVMPPGEFIKELGAEKPQKPVHSYVKAEEPKENPDSDGEEFTAPDTMIEDSSEYTYPPLSLLAAGSGKGPAADGANEARLNSERLETAFHSFGINVGITAYTRGPTVTRYEAELEAGTKLSRITNLEDDIALALGAPGVRIAAMPNKIATVGIEVPNKVVSQVLLRDIIASPEFKNSKSPLTFAIGKNISGEAVVGNISKLPHLLVAGTTGSGKSVCLNSMILSILYKASPDEVKFIMIDPKMVEFKIYNGIPHLLVPVVTDVKKASGALQWAVVEMMKRYRYFSEANARDLASYNASLENDPESEAKPMPQIVIVIDELADLMMTAAKEVEESVCRIAQMGRAAGIHLVIATQSPRADVITGLMKANIPSRIALKVSSSLESRIILDAGGSADKLVGNGDMLFNPIGISKPIRVQGTWVSDSERENVVNFVKQQSTAEYAEDVIHQIDKAAEEKDKGKNGKPAGEDNSLGDYDELLPQAVDIVLDSGQASVSMLQRRLKLGYSRAARLVDQMEELGVVGPFEGSKPRQLLMTRQQWQERQYITGTAPADTPLAEPEDYSPDSYDE